VNKSTKIRLNYVVGAAISLLLLWAIYAQIVKQLNGIASSTWQHTGKSIYLVLALALVFVNSFLESYKWYTLMSWAAPVRYTTALGSYLAGIAFSIITPNRVGEYPGRILYLGGSNTIRYLVVSVSGILSQLAGIYFLGLVGLTYYHMHLLSAGDTMIGGILLPAIMAKVVWVVCIIINILIAVMYWRSDMWLPLLATSKRLRRFALYSKLMSRIGNSNKMKVLALSLLRVLVFTAQYLFLLLWLNVEVPLLQGFCMAALFFWVMAVVPSLALTELGIRGAVGLFIFSQVSPNSIGILAATTSIWVINLILPAIIGSILIIKMKWVK
jgi:hypothetical protein